MSISLSKKSNLTIGSIMMLVGISFIGFASYIYMEPRRILDITTEMNKEVNSCINESKNLGFIVSKKDVKTIFIESNYNYKNKEFIERELYKSSLALEKCKKLDLVNFCAGDGCNDEKLVYFEVVYPFEKISEQYK